MTRRQITKSAMRAEPLKSLQAAWIALLIFLTMGIVLETLHGLKIQYYMSAISGTRRLLWTLAHAHGTLLALIMAVCSLLRLQRVSQDVPNQQFASRLLLAATTLMPAGYVLAGFFVSPIATDTPGLPIVLVPLGSALLLGGVWIFAKS